MPGRLSRRRFLRAAGLGAAAFATGPVGRLLAQDATPTPGARIDFNNELNSYNEIYGYPPLLGRVHVGNRVSIWKGPGPDYGRVRNVFGGGGPDGSYIGPIYRAVHGERYDARFWSPIWYETNDGYMHSAHLIPTREILNEPQDIPPEGAWGEVTVPEAFQRRRPSFDAVKFDWDHYKLFFGQVYRLLERADDDQGFTWYRVYDDIEPERPAWVLARNIRVIHPDEFAPISLGVPDKHLEISLPRQMLSCYEGSKLVFKTRIASGTSFRDDDGTLVDFSTLEGDYLVERKRPSRRMRGGTGVLAYDVNAVPWVVYFGHIGAAIHGAYWHNNYGSPRSHGCINVTPDAAKWIYRWTAPHLSYEEEFRWREAGEAATPIIVV